MTRLNTIADGMSALKNAGDTGKSEVIIEPASKLLGAMLGIMQDAGTLPVSSLLRMAAAASSRCISPGGLTNAALSARVFRSSWMRWNTGRSSTCPGKNFGLMILSTSHGVMSHVQARKEGIGGELLGYVY